MFAPYVELRMGRDLDSTFRNRSIFDLFGATGAGSQFKLGKHSTAVRPRPTTGTDSNDAHQGAVGYVHNLSKRTAVYGTYAAITNGGVAACVVGTPPAADAGKASKGYEVGLRHAF